jgi:ubiquitin
VADDSVLASLSQISDDDTTAVNDREERQEFFNFATARGAAEIAKRMQEGPVKCAQTEECRKRRERVHDEERQPKLFKQLNDMGT